MSESLAEDRAADDLRAGRADERVASTRHRAPLRSLALPTEHGGWGLTAEPGLLGLLLAPSVAGLCLATAAMVAFLARTPLKLAAVDRRRGRLLPRTKLAARVGAVELVVLAALVAGAVTLAESSFWLPAVVAAPLVAVEAYYDVRSRGRQLVPELAGAVGVSSVAAMCVLAAGGSGGLAAGAWLLVAARSTTSIPHVRAQIATLHGRPHEPRLLVGADTIAGLLAVTAVLADRQLVAGAVAVSAIVIAQRRWARRQPARAQVIGFRQLAIGLALVAVTALGGLLIAS